jgi:hypothetical protein
MGIEEVAMGIEYDEVNHPKHYNYFQTETIELLKQMLTSEEFIGYLKGNVLKYRLRAGLKGGKDKRQQDLEKSCWYQDYLDNYQKELDIKGKQLEDMLVKKMDKK